MTMYVDPDFAPAHTLFVLEFEDEGTTEVFALRITPEGTNAWSGQRSDGQSPEDGLRDLMTAFLDERLQAAGLDATVRGFSAEPGTVDAPGVYALHHEARVEHLDGQAVEPLVQRWRALLVDELRSVEVPAKAVGPVHRLSAEEQRLMATPRALAQALADQERPGAPVPSREALQVRRPDPDRPRLNTVLRVATDEGGWGVIGFPLDAVVTEPWDAGRPMDLTQTAFRALQEVSQAYPGTVRWQDGHEQGPLRLGVNLRGRGLVQGAHVDEIPVATLRAADATTTLERLQAKLQGFTGGHTGAAWSVAPGSEAARNLDVLVSEARERLVEQAQASAPAVPTPASGRKPGGR